MSEGTFIQSKPETYHLWSKSCPEISLGLRVHMSGSREGTIATIRFSEGKDPKEIKTTDAVQSLFIKESFVIPNSHALGGRIQQGTPRNGPCPSWGLWSVGQRYSKQKAHNARATTLMIGP